MPVQWATKEQWTPYVRPPSTTAPVYNTPEQITNIRVLPILTETDDEDSEPDEQNNERLSTSHNVHLHNAQNMPSASGNDFHLMSDEIINCYGPNEHMLIDRSAYSQLKGRRFFTLSGFLIVFGYLAMMLGGAYVFTLIEQSNEGSAMLLDVQTRFLQQNPQVNEKMLLNLLKTAIYAQKNGVPVEQQFIENLQFVRRDLVDTNENNTGSLVRHKRSILTKRNPLNSILIRKSNRWDIKSALLFVVSVATTIGYGNIVPESAFGKFLTIIFGLVAIPTTTLLCSVLVAKFCNGPLRRFKLKLLMYHFAKKDNKTLRLIRMISMTLITLFILIVVLGGGAYAFKDMEPSWSYLDAFYFCFISITTTGLGDLVPEFNGTIVHWILEMSTILYLYCGIFFITLWMTQIKACFRKSLTLKLDLIEEEEENVNEDALEEQCLLYYYHQKNYINYGSFYGYDDLTVKIPQRTIVK